MVSDTFKELIECGLRKLTRDLEDRSQSIFGEIPILFACAENTSASPAPSGGAQRWRRWADQHAPAAVAS